MKGRSLRIEVFSTILKGFLGSLLIVLSPSYSLPELVSSMSYSSCCETDSYLEIGAYFKPKSVVDLPLLLSI